MAEGAPDTVLDLHLPEIPGYKLTKRIASGGMASVYRAQAGLLSRPQAVKLLHPELANDPIYRKKFLAEANLISGLSHPGLLKVHHAGEADGVLYIAMDFCSGGTLRSAHPPPLAPSVALRLIKEVADALGVAHAAHVIHRDLNPANILVDDQGRLMIADFGIAKALEVSPSTMTQQGFVVGTLNYMSPEQLAGATVDGRSDIFALGVILFELLTARTPFRADTPYEMAMAHGEALPALPPDAEYIQPFLARMLARALEKRPKDCAELIAEIDRLLLPSPAPSTTSIHQISNVDGHTTVMPAAASRTEIVNAQSREPVFGQTAFVEAKPESYHTQPQLAVRETVDLPPVSDNRMPRGEPRQPAAVNVPASISGTAEAKPLRPRWPWVLTLVLVGASLLLSKPFWPGGSVSAPTADRVANPDQPIATATAPVAEAAKPRLTEVLLVDALQSGDATKFDALTAKVDASDLAGIRVRDRVKAVSAALAAEFGAPPWGTAALQSIQARLLKRADDYFRASVLGLPAKPGENAIDVLRVLIAIAPENEAARRLYQSAIDEYAAAASAAEKSGNASAILRIAKNIAYAQDPPVGEY